MWRLNEKLTYRIKELGCLVLTAALLVGGICLPPFGTQAYAATEFTDFEPDETQKLIEESAALYEEATAHVEDLKKQIEENNARIDELEKDIPHQKERSNTALRELYKLNRDGASLVDLILSSENFSDLLSRFDYVDYIHEQHVATLNSLLDMQTELKETREELSAAQKEAVSQQEVAKAALEEAQQARIRAQKAAQARAAAEAAAAAKSNPNSDATPASANASTQSPDGQPPESQEGQQAPDAQDPASGSGSQNTGSSVSPDGADWNQERSTFVDQWASRIDAYLSGSPLAGEGRVFAEAAWDFGVDPRWSPAISWVESSKGASCFRPYNAWGWGDCSWGSWDEAIRDHVAGLARGYGYSLTKEAAQRYCPPTWEDWYYNVSAEMNSI